MDELTAQIKELRKEVRELKQICSRVNSHITFVEGVYSKAKAPLEYICSYFEGNALVDTPSVKEGEEVD